LKQRAGTLSGGEQKMLILARALMVRPRLVLLDEISEGVQPSVLDRIVEALQRARTQSRTAMLIVEQNLEFAMRVADRWVALQNGEIQASGSCDAEALPLILSRLSW
jgi:branched-chain amino acid transport system ATP-binding protein